MRVYLLEELWTGEELGTRPTESVTPHVRIEHDKDQQPACRSPCCTREAACAPAMTGPRETREVLTRLSASSHACFISLALALFTLTSSLSWSAVAVMSRSRSVLVLVLALALSFASSSCTPFWLFRPRAGMSLRKFGFNCEGKCGR